MWNANGVLIQGLNENTKYIKNFFYQGINAYFQFPLSLINDKECRFLTSEQQSKEVGEHLYLNLEFISNAEIWEGEPPKMRFLGYEYCPIPIDEQIVTDSDWYEPFSIYWNNLNEYGLFDSYDDAVAFIQEYNQAMQDGKIGDGEMDAYLCRVSELI